MKKVLPWAFLIALTPLSALLFAWMLSTVWEWFLAPQYGDGPSYQGWYGIATLWGMLSFGIKKAGATRSEDDLVLQAFIYSLVSYLCLFIILGLAGFVRLVLGWK